MNVKAIVLAAGKGTRLQTDEYDAPKVMRAVCGKPLLGYVLDALGFINKEDIIIVVGYKKEQIIDKFGDYPTAIQAEQLGTGHAVMAAAEHIEGFDGSVLVCYGDMPALTRGRYEELAKTHFEHQNDCTILTGESDGALAFGRIVRDRNGDFVEVVEERDCTPEQLSITELNSGVYMFRASELLKALKGLKRDNSQGEYYLTDAPAIIRENGLKVGLYHCNLGDEIIGVNTLEQLAQVEEILTSKQ